MNQAQVLKIAGIDKNHPVMSFIREVSTAGNYRFRVIVAGATLELLITTLVKHHCKRHGGKFAKFTFDRKLLILHEMGILSDNRYRLLKLFKDLRNDAAHEHKFEITKETLSKFPITITTNREDYIVFHICAKMVMELWNEHSNVLISYFNEQARK
jgi:hypothetical protein